MSGFGFTWPAPGGGGGVAGFRALSTGGPSSGRSGSVQAETVAAEMTRRAICRRALMVMRAPWSWPERGRSTWRLRRCGARVRRTPPGTWRRNFAPARRTPRRTAQMVRPAMLSATFFSTFTSSGRPWPVASRSVIFFIQSELRGRACTGRTIRVRRRWRYSRGTRPCRVSRP